jgi:methyltransferase (TIGR00027 family)
LGQLPHHVTYAPIDFATESLAEVLRNAGHRPIEKTFYICEGVSMYVPEEGMRETLRTVAALSPPGSSMLLEYMNRAAIELSKKLAIGVIKNARDWGEPFVFGVPDGQDREFFRESGLELGETLRMGGPESVKRYAMCADGTYYGSHLAKVFEERRKAAFEAFDDNMRQQIAQASQSGYWLAELIVPERPS